MAAPLVPVAASAGLDKNMASSSADENGNERKRALLTGITGQDGSYLAELLLEKGYEVHGVVRRSSSFNTHRLEHIYHDPHERGVRLFLHYGDLSDASCLLHLLAKVRPHEVYNLGAQSHVKVSFELSEYSADVDALGTLRILDAIRSCGLEKATRFYQASTSEMYGGVYSEAQDESTPFYPRSPYAVAKQFAHWITINYREAYGMFACCGTLFNHESPRRGATFVTRKITRAVSEIVVRGGPVLHLGNLDALRDWGHARDYVRGMWLMLQQDTPDDFVLATNENHSVREFTELAFKHVNIEIEWEDIGENEVGKNKATGEIVVRVDPRYYRPTEVDQLLGNSAKAKRVLGWEPEVSFLALVKDMMDSDLAKAQKGLRQGDE